MSRVFLWCDIETTGLDERNDTICEIVLLATTDYLREIDHVGLVISHPDVDLLRAGCNDFVRDMHDRSGLWGDMRHHGIPLSEAEEIGRKFVVEHTEADKLPLGGSSVHFDRAFLRHHTPTLEAEFAYRNIDVSTLKELAKVWRPSVFDLRPNGFPKPHRGLDDLRHTLRELAYYREFLFNL